MKEITSTEKQIEDKSKEILEAIFDFKTEAELKLEEVEQAWEEITFLHVKIKDILGGNERWIVQSKK